MINIVLKCFAQTLVASSVAAFIGGFVIDTGADINALLKGSTIFFFIILSVEVIRKILQTNKDHHR